MPEYRKGSTNTKEERRFLFMNYSDIINQSIEKVYQNGIAAKILQHMDRIRNVSDIGQARR